MERQIDVKCILADVQSGMPAKAIAKKHGIGGTTLKAIKVHNGIEKDDRFIFVAIMLRLGVSAENAALCADKSLSSVYSIGAGFGITFPGNDKVTDQMRAEIEQMIRSGATRKQTCEATGLSCITVQRVAREAGLMFSGDCRQYDLEKNAKARIENNAPGFEYLDGYDNYNSTVRIRCKRCGAIKVLTYDHASRGRVGCECEDVVHKCPTCGKMTTRPKYCSDACERSAWAARRQEETRPQREAAKAERERKRREREEARIAEQERKKAERVHACPVCGRMTDRKKYCSDVCANRMYNKAKDHKRRNKIATAMVDNDITLEAVWRNGLGVCYICGCVTDWNDKREENGTIICGDRYPSIDHIVPLARGGKHSWSNCALACRKCNWEKSDSPAPPQPRRTGCNRRLGQRRLSPGEV